MDPGLNVETPNYKSATNSEARPYVERQIKDELANGHYVIVENKPQIVSALGAIPKDASNKTYRIIHDASRPYGSALNDFADHDPFRYQSLQDAIDLVKPGYYLGKIDLKNAFRSVGISPSNYCATGLKWRFSGHKEDTYMVDTRVCFGGRRSPEIFNMLSQAVVAMMNSYGYMSVVCYCDDFLIVEPTYDKCKAAMSFLMWLLRRLGFSISYNKVLGPSQVMVFLGIELNTLDMSLALPPDKLHEIRQCIARAMVRCKLTKRELQSIIGKLSWATQVIHGGRFHLRRLLDRIRSLRYPSHRTRLTRDMRADMSWWLHFMDVFNGHTKMVESRPAAPVVIDACSEAAGSHYDGHSLYTPWQQCWPSAAPLHINHKEVLALEPAATVWAPMWANKRIYVHCDNRSAVYTINKGLSKHPAVMDSLRRVFWLSALYNFRLTAVYYPGHCNVIADSVSRLHERGGLHRFYGALFNSCVQPHPGVW